MFLYGFSVVLGVSMNPERIDSIFAEPSGKSNGTKL